MGRGEVKCSGWGVCVRVCVWVCVCLLSWSGISEERWLNCESKNCFNILSLQLGQASKVRNFFSLPFCSPRGHKCHQWLVRVCRQILKLYMERQFSCFLHLLCASFKYHATYKELCPKNPRRQSHKSALPADLDSKWNLNCSAASHKEQILHQFRQYPAHHDFKRLTKRWEEECNSRCFSFQNDQVFFQSRSSLPAVLCYVCTKLSGDLQACASVFTSLFPHLLLHFVAHYFQSRVFPSHSLP